MMDANKINKYIFDEFAKIQEAEFKKSFLGTSSEQPIIDSALTIDKVVEAFDKVSRNYRLVMVITVPDYGLIPVDEKDLINHLEDWENLGYKNKIYKIEIPNPLVPFRHLEI